MTVIMRTFQYVRCTSEHPESPLGSLKLEMVHEPSFTLALKAICMSEHNQTEPDVPENE